MRSLIDEHFKASGMEAPGINVPPSEVDKRISDLAKRNNMSREVSEAFLAGNGILVDTLADQIAADLGWARMVPAQTALDHQDHRPGESTMPWLAPRRLRARPNTDSPRFFSEWMPANDEAAIRQSADRLLEQLQQGADFASLAASFPRIKGQSKVGFRLGPAGRVDPGWQRSCRP